MTMLSLFILIYGDRLPAEVESNSEPFGRCPRQRYQDLVSLRLKKHEGRGLISTTKARVFAEAIRHVTIGRYSKLIWVYDQGSIGTRGKPI